MSGQKLTPIEIDQIIAKTNYCLLYHYDKNMLMFAISETKLNFIIKRYVLLEGTEGAYYKHVQDFYHQTLDKYTGLNNLLFLADEKVDLKDKPSLEQLENSWMEFLNSKSN